MAWVHKTLLKPVFSPGGKSQTFSFDWKVSCKSDVNKYPSRESLCSEICNHAIGRTDFLIAKHLVNSSRIYFQHKILVVCCL